ncbi:MAG: MinD/ParA family protein [Polyangia bacterium]
MDQADNLRLRLVNRPPVVEAPRELLRVIAVTSGKGGVGKTNMSANLAALAARAGKRVLILDADLGLANVDIIFGVKPMHHIGDLLQAGVSAMDVLIQTAPNIHILPAGSGVQRLTELERKDKLRLVAALDGLEDHFDLVIIDSGAGIGDNVLFFVGMAQEVVLVLSPEPTSLVDAYAVVKVLSQQAGIRNFAVVINPVVDEMPARDMFQKLSTVTGRFLTAKLRHLGYVPRDENVHRAVMAQRPVVDLFPMAPASRAIAEVAARLFSEPAPQILEGGMKMMWQRLMREAEVPR